MKKGLASRKAREEDKKSWLLERRKRRAAFFFGFSKTKNGRSGGFLFCKRRVQRELLAIFGRRGEAKIVGPSVWSKERRKAHWFWPSFGHGFSWKRERREACGNFWFALGGLARKKRKSSFNRWKGGVFDHPRAKIAPSVLFCLAHACLRNLVNMIPVNESHFDSWAWSFLSPLNMAHMITMSHYSILGYMQVLS